MDMQWYWMGGILGRHAFLLLFLYIFATTLAFAEDDDYDTRGSNPYGFGRAGMQRYQRDQELRRQYEETPAPTPTGAQPSRSEPQPEAQPAPVAQPQPQPQPDPVAAARAEPDLPTPQQLPGDQGTGKGPGNPPPQRDDFGQVIDPGKGPGGEPNQKQDATFMERMAPLLGDGPGRLSATTAPEPDLSHKADTPNPDHDSPPREEGPPIRVRAATEPGKAELSGPDLERMTSAVENIAKSGNTEEAKQKLEVVRGMLEVASEALSEASKAKLTSAVSRAENALEKRGALPTDELAAEVLPTEGKAAEALEAVSSKIAADFPTEGEFGAGKTPVEDPVPVLAGLLGTLDKGTPVQQKGLERVLNALLKLIRLGSQGVKSVGSRLAGGSGSDSRSQTRFKLPSVVAGFFAGSPSGSSESLDSQEVPWWGLAAALVVFGALAGLLLFLLTRLLLRRRSALVAISAGRKKSSVPHKK